MDLIHDTGLVGLWSGCSWVLNLGLIANLVIGGVSMFQFASVDFLRYWRISTQSY
jgi:hypothetical protein